MNRWPAAPLAELASVIRGVSFDKSQVSDAPAVNSVPILRAGNIQESLLTGSDLVYVPSDIVGDEQRLKRGDLAICMSSGSPAIVGKTAYLDTDWTGSVGAFCGIVRFNQRLNHRFGSYWFRGPAYLRWRDASAKGANIQNLRRTELERLFVPVPPLAEQERIVKLLDQVDELRKLRAQADRRTADLIPALFHEMFGDPISNPKRWPIVKLSALGEWASGGTPPRSSPMYYEGDIDWYSAGELTSIYLSNSNEKITRKAIDETSAKLFKKGSLLIGMYDTAAFKMGILAKDASSNQACVNVDPDPSMCSPLWLYANLMAMKEHFLRQRRGVRQQNLSLAMIKSFEIPLPPLPLQNEMATRIAEIHELKAKQAASRERLDALFQSMLHRAFRGEL